MEKFYSSLMTLRPMQAVVLAFLLVTAAGLTYAGYELSSRGPSSDLAEDQQLIPIGYGDLVRQVTTSGSLVFANRESMTFGTAGTVDELMVRDGQVVTAGQELARLDATTTASLAQSVAQAQVDLIAAQKALDELVVPTALGLAQAKQTVASAEFDLKAANEALDDANVPFSQDDIKTQEQVVASAKSKSQAAEDSLGQLGQSHTQSLAQALLTKADADSAWVDAKNALEAYETANSATLDAARVTQAEAQKNYDTSVLELQTLLESQAAGVPGLGGPILQSQDLLAVRQVRLDAANADLVKLEQLQAKRDKTESDLAAATAAVADLSTGSVTPSVSSQLVKIETARANLEEVKSLGLDTIVAEAELAALRLGLSAIESGADPIQVSLSESDLVQARAKLATEEQELLDMIAGPDSITLALRSRDVGVAVASLEQATQDLGYVLLPRAEDLALLESKLTVAEAAYASALDKKAAATLTAPFDGFIAEVAVAEGDQVGANALIVEVVDPSVVEMDGIVDQVDILQLKEGIAASVTVDALPGRVLTGIVTEIASVATDQQGVITYPVRVQVVVPEGVQFRDGLSAVANLVLEQQLNVLLVPQTAIFGSFQAPTVKVQTDSGIVDRAVVLGGSDDFWSEVVEGLEAGDRVVMQTSEAASNQFGSFRSFGGGNRSSGGIIVERRLR